MIVGGDFNTITRRGIKGISGQFAQIRMLRASRGAGPTIRVLGTWTAAADHIFTRGFQAVAAGVVDAARASDHFPVWAELVWSNRAQ